MPKAETCKRTSGVGPARSESADRCVDGKRPSCPVKEPSTCSAAAAAAPAPAGRMDAYSSAFSLQRSDRRKREEGGATSDEAVVHF